jgi:thiopeptide-type bacteriocin biosynthesis protein
MFREALQIASGSLADSLDRLDMGAGIEAKRLRRTALAVSRYALRAETRPTPFGLFAGVTPARAADTTKVSLFGSGRKTVRLDAAWLTRRVTEWLALPEVRRGVDVVLSDLCRTRGDRLVVRGNASEVSIRNTALVTWVCEQTPQPVAYRDLLRQASAVFPCFTPDQVDATLFQLVRLGFLLTSITPQNLDDALLDRITAAVSPVPGLEAEFQSIRQALDAYAAMKPGEGNVQWRALMRLTDPLGTAVRPPVHVDLRMNADVRLSRTVTEEAARYASAMWELSGDWLTHSHMRIYRGRFVEAYGTSGVIPLGRLVDQHRGIGFPPGYDEPVGAESPGAREQEPLPKARRLLTHDLVQEALLSGDDEVRLTPGLVDRLADGHTAGAAVPPPRSLELCFQLLAESGEAIDRGDFRLVSSVYTGSWLAGATVGRFAELTRTEGELSSLLAETGDAGTIPAQVVYRPRTLRALNMAQVPRLLPHQIPVSVYADRNAPGTLDWRRLLVTPDATGLRLILPDDGREVLPVVPHMLALDREAPPVARLLVDLVFGRARTWTGWNWCGLEGLPYLPRVTYSRVTILPRRWVPDRYLRETAGSSPVNLARWDRMYSVDLTDAWQREVFRQEVRAGGSLVIMEDLTDGGRQLGWSSGHSAEVVIPFKRAAAPGRFHRSSDDGVRRDDHQETTARSRPAVIVRRPTDDTLQHLPGESWLYAKFYAAEHTHDELLHTCLPTLVRAVGDELRSWHFIRYRDPEPHIRLRLHGDPEALRTKVLPRLNAESRAWQEAGAIRTMVLDTYRPETDRYAGSDALPHAERMFCVDSQSALAQLGMRARGRLDLPAPVLAAVNHALLLESLGDWDWPAWISRTLPKGPAHAAYQRYREQATALILPGRAAVSATPVLGAPLTDMWHTAPETRRYGALLLSEAGRAPATEQHAEAVMSLLHMQHNRLLGIDRTGEDAGYAVLRGVARDHQGRLAHARDKEEETG